MHNTNIINLKSEVLFREAEDDFLYFNKLKNAIKKLEESILLTPSHHKSYSLLGDALFMQGKVEKALENYQKADKYINNSKVIASIAMCLEAKGEYKEALKHCDKAFLYINEDNCQLYLSLYELKTTILLKLRKYEEAKKFIESAKNNLSIEDLMNFKTQRELINSKLRLKEKMEKISLRAL